MSHHPAVRETAAIVLDDEHGTKRLVAYLKVEESRRPAIAELREWVAQSLPEYMVPSLFVFLAALPRTPNGKLDRKSLPSPEAGSEKMRASTFETPRTASEASLAAICRDVLHLDRVGVHDSLFDLGADSVHIFQIIARASRSGINIAPQQLLRLRTVAALAADLDANGGMDLKAAKDAEKIAPASRDQYRMGSGALVV